MILNVQSLLQKLNAMKQRLILLQESSSASVGSGQTDVLIIDLPFECDNKGLYDLVSCSYNESICLLKTSCPDPEDDDKLHWVKVLIFSLGEAAAKSVEARS